MMSLYTGKVGYVTLTKIQSRKTEKKKISAITCYDASFARLIDQTDIDIILVGDSLGNVMMGYDHTIPVTVQDMIHHTACVSRVVEKPFLVADMPFMSYNISNEQALENATRLIQEGGAQAVKVEGGAHILPQVKAMVDAGIPVMGHLGLTPQSLHAAGGYKIVGREQKQKEKLISDAKALQDAGCFSLVLEMVPYKLAERLTDELDIPTIGIGAGPNTDGQILVLHDILGFNEDFNPKFLKKYAQMGKMVREAVTAYNDEVKSGEYPTLENSFSE
jgi:3-methyl-2-oxobutanoate hydroxymethyltransferase